ncbi:carboxymuconolactone decarboxylase family protein [bacterium]|nr:carboxymuconolactone decarboxylase family protein [bacterium]
MSIQQSIQRIIEEHPNREQLILLSALSVLWLKPQEEQAHALIEQYQAKNFPLEALRETALQLYLVAGFQASLEAAFQIKEVYGDGLPAKGEHIRDLSTSEILNRGYDLQAEVYRENVEKLRANLSVISPELSEWTVFVGYGLTLSRPGLKGCWRELFEVAVLAAQDFPRQLHSHFRGALHLGASREEVELILQVVEAILGPDRVKSAWQMWHRIK